MRCSFWPIAAYRHRQHWVELYRVIEGSIHTTSVQPYQAHTLPPTAQANPARYFSFATISKAERAVIPY